MKTVFLAEQVFDGLHPEPQRHRAVVVEDGQIVASGPRDEVPIPRGDDVRVVEIRGGTLVPGFIDSHVHLTLHPAENIADFPRQAREDSPAILAARAIRHGQLCLRAGVTTVRDCGDIGLVTLAVREAIRSGWVAGPRIIASGFPITVTGGHCHWMGGPACDDIPALRLAVRQLVKNGADFIKVMASGGLMTPGSQAFEPAYTQEELTAVVSEARRLGRYVAAHCLCTVAVKNAVRAGAHTVEHCLLWNSAGVPEWDDGVAAEIIERGVWVGATFSSLSRRHLPAPDTSPDAAAAGLAELQRYHAQYRRLWQAGARFLFHSDAGVVSTRFEEFGHGLVAAGLALELGVSDTLMCVTRHPAEALGLAHQVGSIATGLQADLVELEGDPWQDPMALTRVRRVWQNGRLVVDGDMLAGPAGSA